MPHLVHEWNHFHAANNRMEVYATVLVVPAGQVDVTLAFDESYPVSIIELD